MRFALFLAVFNFWTSSGVFHGSLVTQARSPCFSRWEPGPHQCGDDALVVKPSAGDAVLFYNVRGDMLPDVASMHAGCPVKRGEKYVITAWAWTGDRYHTEFGPKGYKP